MTHRYIVNGELVLHGDVGDLFGGLFGEDDGFFTARGVLEALAEIEGDVIVRLNSGGGVVWEGTAIHAALAARAAAGDRVVIHIEGVAASAATFIAMAGTEVVMAEGAMFMIHDPADRTAGTAADHKETADFLDKVADDWAATYARSAGITVAEARAIMIAETWYTAEEAVAAGFADRMIVAEAGEKTAAAAVFDYSVYARAPDRLVAWAKTNCGDDRRLDRGRLLLAGLKPAAIPAHSPAALEIQMTKTAVEPAAPATPKAPAAAAPAAAIDPEALTAQIEGAVTAERRRASAIRTVGASLDIDPAEIAKAIDDGLEVTAFQEQAIATVAARKGEPGHGIKTQAAVITADVRDRFREGAVKGLLAKAGHKDGERNEFAGLTLRELARESLTMSGHDKRYSDPRDMVGRAFTHMSAGAHGTSDFPFILADVAHKMMMVGYEEADETFEMWTRAGTLSDFKTASRVDIGTFPSLAVKAEGADYQMVTIGERKEPIALATYGNIFKITREAVINDDLGAFTRIPRKMGRAAIRTVGDLAYAVLTANAALNDGVALFHANHGNLAGAGVPSVTTWDAARTAMGIQKDGTATLNIRPKYTLVPLALEGVSKVLAASEFDPAQTQRVPSSVAGMVEVISDARLDAASTTKYYFAADPNLADTIEVAYLNGERTPYMEERTAWSSDGAEFKVRMDAAAAALDYRGLHRRGA